MSVTYLGRPTHHTDV